ncbi:hypothetical protein KBC85_00235 [Candidatus Saccharibacteria bacterium]|nr:hypothetical protein [Candidatus Saccharibacteria bacterium]MDQ5958834.1 hypothetical protein [Patescibacteria group bacterium]
MNKIKLQTLEIIDKIATFLVRYKVTILLVIASLILSILFIAISFFTNVKPNNQQISQAEETVKLITIKKESIKVVESLKENNISIESIFAPGRYDPFQSQ